MSGKIRPLLQNKNSKKVCKYTYSRMPMDEPVHMEISTVDDFFSVIEGIVTDPDNFDKLPDNMIFAKDYETLHKIQQNRFFQTAILMMLGQAGVQ